MKLAFSEKYGFAILLAIREIYFVTSYTAINASKDGQNICTSEACNLTASILIKSINESADPCDDFYQFACGNFIESSKLPFDVESIGPLDIRKKEIQEKLEKSLQEKVSTDEPRTFQILKHYYKACVDKDKIKEHEYMEILKDLGGWPLLVGKSWNELDFEWVNIIHKFQNLGYKSQDFINVPTKMIEISEDKITVEISPPEIIGNSEYFFEILSLNKKDAYLKYIVNVANIFKHNSSNITQEINKMLDFEIELSQIAFQNSTEESKTMTVNELQKKYPTIDWLDYLNKKLFPQPSLKDTDEVIINNATYFKNFFQLMGKTPKREVANYAFWCFLEENTQLLSTRIRNIENDFLNELKGRNFRDYDDDCVTKLIESFPVAMNMFYVKKHFDVKKKNLVFNMLEDIRISIRKMLESVNWLDSDTKNAALEKLKKITAEVGYSDKFLNRDVLDSYYSFLDVDLKNTLKTEMSILGNKLELDKFSYSMKDDWMQYGPTEVNAAFMSEINTIFILLGEIETDIFDVDNPKYVLYGLMGYTIGHELGHAIDSLEELFSEFIRSNHTWNTTTEQEFVNRSGCIVDQYSNYTLKGFDINLNGNKTNMEDIADYVGFKAAYDAYKEWQKKNGPEARLPGLEKYTPNQMFWLSSAQCYCQKISEERLKELVEGDPHTVGEFRVTGALYDRPEFSEDFGCPFSVFVFKKYERISRPL